jgi:hypothetical protein
MMNTYQIPRTALALALAFTACSSGSQQQKPPKELMSLISWGASVAMIGEEWLSGAATTTFASKALDNANQEIGREIQALTSQPIPDSARMALFQHLGEIQNLVLVMQKGIEKEDRSLCSGAFHGLNSEKQAIDSITRSNFAKP